MRSRLQSDNVQGTLESTGAKPRAKKEANGVEAFAYSTRETCSTGLSRPTTLVPLSRFMTSSSLSLSPLPSILALSPFNFSPIHVNAHGSRGDRGRDSPRTLRRDTHERSMSVFLEFSLINQHFGIRERSA